MAVRPESMRRLRDVTFAARLFLIVALVALVAAVALVAYRQGAFKESVKVHFYAGTADGLNRGMAVKLVGFKVGSLDTIAVDTSLRVKVSLKIDQAYANVIDRDATIRVAKENIIGTNVLEVLPGNGDLGPIKDGSELRYARDPSIEAAVVALVNQVGPVVDEIRRLTGYLNDSQGDVRQTLAHLKTTAATLAAASGDLKRVFALVGSRLDETSGDARKALASADRLVNETRAMLATVDGSARRIDAALPGIVMKLDESLQDMRETSRAMLTLVTNDMPRLVNDGADLVASGRETMSDVRRTWPLSGLVDHEERLLKLDSGGALLALPAGPSRTR